MLISIMTSTFASFLGNLFIILLLCLPIVLFITLIIGIIKKNKKLWIISLIFLIITLFLNLAINTFNPKPVIKHTTTTQATTKSNNTIK